MNTRRIALIILAALYCHLTTLFAQSVQYRYDLPNSNVNALAQDRAGFLWLGTSDGLCKYNGTGYLNFYASSDSLSLQDAHIYALHEDDMGRLWFANDCGLGYMFHGKFYFPENTKYNNIRHISHLDSLGAIITDHHSISLLAPDFTEKAHYVRPHLMRPTIHAVPETREVWTFYFDKSNQTENLLILDDKLKLREQFTVQRPILHFIPDLQNQLMWTIGSKGMACYSLTTHQPVALPAPLQNAGRIVFAQILEPGQLILGISDQGIYSYDIDSQQLSLLDENFVLSSRETYQTLVDNNKTLWIYSKGEGLQFIPYHPIYQSYVREFESLSARNLNPLGCDNKGNLWFGTSRNILHFDPRQSKLTSCIDDYFHLSYMDAQKRIWTVNFDRILSCYETQGTTCTRVKQIELPEVPRSICEDSYGRIWLAYSHELYTIEENGTTTQLALPNSIYCKGLYNSRPTHRLFLFSSTDTYIVTESQAKLSLHPLPIQVKNPTCFIETGEGILWIGSLSHGLTYYNFSTHVSRHWDISSGLISNKVNALQMDRIGDLWFTSGNCISHLNTEGTAFTHTRDVHLLNSEGYLGSCSGHDGTIYFGAEGGMTRIFPNRLENSDPSPDIPVYLDILQVNGHQYPGSFETIHLNHNQNNLSIWFSGLNYRNSSLLIYEYKLEGEDKEWCPVTSEHKAVYSRLSAGKYTFRARVRNLNGQWSPRELTLLFDIHPAPWATWWAKLLYVLLLLGLVLGGIWLFTRWRLREERLKLVERQNELSKQHVDFVTNISHELRTPLTLITAPLAQLSRNTSLSGHDKTLIRYMQNSAARLQRLATQIVDIGNGKVQAESSLHVVEGHLPDFVKDIVNNFNFIASEKHLSLQFLQTDDIDKGYFDTEKVEKILTNLLSNAVKYTPEEGGGVVVSIQPVSKGQVSISVSDTGIGVPEDKREGLFQRFNRLSIQKMLPEIQGSGVGLNYAQYLAKLHHGNLDFRPVEPHGASFIFSFPYTSEAYSEAERTSTQDIAVHPTPGNDNETEASLHTSNVPKKGSILVAEDTPEMRTYIKDLLSSTFDVTTAQNGIEAIDLLKTGFIPDLIISDVVMPGKDGYQLCAELKQNSDLRHLPFLLLTAKTDARDQIQGLDCGADAYMPKPFDPDVLIHQAENLIQKHKEIQHILSGLTSETLSSIDNRLSGSDEPDSTSDTSSSLLSEQDHTFLQNLYARMDEHLSEEGYNVAQLASDMNFSYSRFYVKVKLLTGESPLSLLSTYRMNKAMEMLRSRKYTVSEVSIKVGSSTLANFSRSFKRQFGIPPSEV